MHAASIFCRDRGPYFVGVPQAKRMHQIVRSDFENYHLYPLLRGAHPPQIPLVHTGAEALSILNLGAPSFKKS